MRLNDRLDLTTDFGMGVSWGWKEFDGETASESSVLGSDLNARIDWGFYAAIRDNAQDPSCTWALISRTDRTGHESTVTWGSTPSAHECPSSTTLPPGLPIGS